MQTCSFHCMYPLHRYNEQQSQVHTQVFPATVHTQGFTFNTEQRNWYVMVTENDLKLTQLKVVNSLSCNHSVIWSCFLFWMFCQKNEGSVTNFLVIFSQQDKFYVHKLTQACTAVHTYTPTYKHQYIHTLPILSIHLSTEFI